MSFRTALFRCHSEPLYSDVIPNPFYSDIIPNRFSGEEPAFPPRLVRTCAATHFKREMHE